MTTWRTGLRLFEMAPGMDLAKNLAMTVIRIRYGKSDICTHGSPVAGSRFGQFDLGRSIAKVCSAEDWTRLLVVRHGLAQL